MKMIFFFFVLTTQLYAVWGKTWNTLLVLFWNSDLNLTQTCVLKFWGTFCHVFEYRSVKEGHQHGGMTCKICLMLSHTWKLSIFSSSLNLLWPSVHTAETSCEYNTWYICLFLQLILLNSYVYLISCGYFVNTSSSTGNKFTNKGYALIHVYLIPVLLAHLQVTSSSNKWYLSIHVYLYLLLLGLLHKYISFHKHLFHYLTFNHTLLVYMKPISFFFLKHSL